MLKVTGYRQNQAHHFLFQVARKSPPHTSDVLVHTWRPIRLPSLFVSRKQHEVTASGLTFVDKLPVDFRKRGSPSLGKDIDRAMTYYCGMIIETWRLGSFSLGPQTDKKHCAHQPFFMVPENTTSSA